MGSPLNVSYAEFFRFVLQFLCLQMCVYGGSAVPEGGVGDRHLVTVPQGVVGDRLPWGWGQDRGGGVNGHWRASVLRYVLLTRAAHRYTAAVSSGVPGIAPQRTCTALHHRHIGRWGGGRIGFEFEELSPVRVASLGSLHCSALSQFQAFCPTRGSVWRLKCNKMHSHTVRVG